MATKKEKQLQEELIRANTEAIQNELKLNDYKWLTFLIRMIGLVVIGGFLGIIFISDVVNGAIFGFAVWSIYEMVKLA